MLRFIKTENEVEDQQPQVQQTLVGDNEEEPNSSTNIPETTNGIEQQSQFQETLYGDNEECPSLSKYMKVDVNALPTDPGERPMMEFYHVSQRDEIRIAYLQRGPFQPRNHLFQQRKIGAGLYKFNPAWFDDYKYWLEYSIEKDAAFCLCCYLFVSELKKQNGFLAFVKDGFKGWNKRERLSFHNAGTQHILAVQKCKNLMNQSQSISTDHKGNDIASDDDVDVDWTPTSTRSANKKKGQSSQSMSSGMEGLEKKIAVLMKKQEEKIIETLLKRQGEQFAVLAGLVGREVSAHEATADKRARLNDELKKITDLSLRARLQAASVIVGDSAKLDLFYSLCNEERKEWVSMLLSGLI